MHVFYSAGMPDSPDEKKAVADADVVVVAVGFDPKTEREGHDRTFTLPPGQDALIEAVAAANPHTIVMLTAGGGVDTSRWLDKVPASCSTPGIPARKAARPSRRFSSASTTPRANCPSPSIAVGNRILQRSGTTAIPRTTRPFDTIGEDGKPKDYTIEHIKYGDKLMVGYRYWTTTGKHPLFPFGFGLSYTTFSFSNLQAPATAASAPMCRSASTSPTPAAWPEPKWPSSTSPTLRRTSIAPSAS